MEIPLIYDFQTRSGNHYVYDATTNHTFSVDEVDIHVIKNFRRMSLSDMESFLSPQFKKEEIINSYNKVLFWIEKEGTFFPKESTYNEPKLLSKKEYFDKLANLNQMSLEVTQRCNLRCKYCVYGGTHRYYRIHSNLSMSWNVAKKSIDYFLKQIKSKKRTTLLEKAAFSFYGGEPLIEFNLIQKCVNYIRKKCASDEIQFGITTNGTLLSENIVKFLIKNNFSILLSLDGPSREHDKNRVFANGSPTFAKIWKNFKMIKKLDYNFYSNNLRFNTIITPYNNIAKVISFFRKVNTSGVKRGSRIDIVNSTNSTYYENVPGNTIESYKKQLNLLYEEYLNMINCNKDWYLDPLENLFGDRFGKFGERYSPSKDTIWGPDLCLPGIYKIFVSTDGKFHACEKINHHFSVGNYKFGIDYLKIKELITKFVKSVRTGCTKCYAARFCPICYAAVCKENCFDAKEICIREQNTIKGIIRDYYSILEENPGAFNNKFDIRMN